MAHEIPADTWQRLTLNMSTVSSSRFRNALGNYATGVAIVSACGDDRNPIGMTVNSFASVSLEPPLVLWSVDKKSPLCDAFVSCDYYAVHILQAGQEHLARTFSDDGADKFNGMSTERGLQDLPLLKECPMLMQCKVQNVHDEGDHFILVGEVLDLRSGTADPLIFFSGDYTRLLRE